MPYSTFRLRLFSLAVGAIAVLAACEGSRTIPPAWVPGGAFAASAAGGSSPVEVLLAIPARNAFGTAAAAAAWAIPEPRSAALTVDGRAMRFEIGRSARGCAADRAERLCHLAFRLAPGTHVVRLDLFGPAAISVGSATTAFTQLPGHPQVVAFAAGGIPARIVLAPETVVFAPDPAHTPRPGVTPAYAAPIYVTAQTKTGRTIVTSRYGKPINVQIFEPAARPVTILGATGSKTSIALAGPSQGQPLTLQYAGGTYVQPLSLVATADRAANASALLVNGTYAPPGSCTPAPASQSARIPLADKPSVAYYDLFKIPVWIGAKGTPTNLNLDTGSVGLAVSTDLFIQMMGFPRPTMPPPGKSIPFPKNLPPGVSGPGTPGQITYTSDGLVEMGNYFTAPLTFGTKNGTTTVPMQILVVTRHGCNPLYLHGGQCPPPSAYGSENMGIGFAPLDLSTSSSPVQNPFLQLRAMLAGQMPRRYILNNRGMIFGGSARDLAGFQWIKLQQNRAIPGDWDEASMCLAFPDAGNRSYTCGQMLVDTGLRGMILDVPTGQQIPNLTGYVNAHKRIEIVAPGFNPGAPSANPPVLDWTFAAPGTSPSPQPTYPAALPQAMLLGKGGNAVAFVNTSQRLLFAYDYSYDADCGAVGFRAASPPPP